MDFVSAFWSNVFRRRDSECWPWLGVTSKGYGKLSLNGKRYRATHIALFIKNGTWPTAHALHSCDNPICVNPAHLREGTHQENMAEAWGRKRFPKGEDRNFAKLTNEQVLEIQRRSHDPLDLLAKEFDVSFNTVWRIRVGQTWRDVTGSTEVSKKRKLTRLPEEERYKAYIRLLNGETLATVARDFGVGEATMCRIRKEALQRAGAIYPATNLIDETAQAQ